MGSRCVLCGYDKCINALHVHHIDPSKKSLTFSNILSYKKEMPTTNELILEMENCCLLCANCHAEVHAIGLENITLETSFDQSRFDEFITNCKICGYLNNNPFYKYCRCLSKNTNVNKTTNFVIDWDKFDVLLLLHRFDGNFSAVGRELNITDNAVRKQFYKVTGYKSFSSYEKDLSIITLADNQIDLNFINIGSNFINTSTTYDSLYVNLIEILQDNEYDLVKVAKILNINVQSLKKRLYRKYGSSCVEILKLI